jgi:hypothetical protein
MAVSINIKATGDHLNGKAVYRGHADCITERGGVLSDSYQFTAPSLGHALEIMEARYPSVEVMEQAYERSRERDQ